MIKIKNIFVYQIEMNILFHFMKNNENGGNPPKFIIYKMLIRFSDWFLLKLNIKLILYLFNKYVIIIKIRL